MTISATFLNFKNGNLIFPHLLSQSILLLYIFLDRLFYKI